MKKIGVLFGMENSFPGALVQRINTLDVDGITASALDLAREAGEKGGTLPAVLNAANEVAVEAFLAGRIAFGGIARHVAEAIDAALGNGSAKEPATVAEALGVDHIVRERSRAILAGR